MAHGTSGERLNYLSRIGSVIGADSRGRWQRGWRVEQEVEVCALGCCEGQRGRSLVLSSSGLPTNVGIGKDDHGVDIVQPLDPEAALFRLPFLEDCLNVASLDPGYG